MKNIIKNLAQANLMTRVLFGVMVIMMQTTIYSSDNAAITYTEALNSLNSDKTSSRYDNYLFSPINNSVDENTTYQSRPSTPNSRSFSPNNTVSDVTDDFSRISTPVDPEFYRFKNQPNNNMSRSYSESIINTNSYPTTAPIDPTDAIIMNLYKKYQYKDNDTYNLNEIVNELIAQSYTLEDQWNVYQLYKAPFVVDIVARIPMLYTLDGKPVINNSTKKQYNMPTVEQIVAAVPPHAQITKNTIAALKSALDAVNTALYLANLQAAYHENKQNYKFYQTADADIQAALKTKRSTLKDKIDSLENLKGLKDDKKAFEYTMKPLDNQNHIMIAADDMKSIVAQNNFKKMIDYRDQIDKLRAAANLLFKECFIAQQSHLKNEDMFRWIESQDHLYAGRNKNYIPYNYLFAGLPNYKDFVSQVKELPTAAEKNMVLKLIRQAVQTALYIAQQNSNYYITTDPFVQIFKDWDAELAALTLKPENGATVEDLERSRLLWNLTNFATGVAVIGTAAAAYYSYQNPDQVKNIANQVKNFASTTGTAIKEGLKPIKPSYLEQLKAGYTPGSAGLTSFNKGVEEDLYGTPEGWSAWLKGPQKGYIAKGYDQVNQYLNLNTPSAVPEDLAERLAA